MGITSKREKIAQAVFHLVFIGICLTVIIPFLLVFMSSITEENELIRNGYRFWPGKFSFAAYEYIFRSSTALVRAYGISLLITVVGTILGLSIVTLYAYPLSRPEFKGKNLFTFIAFFTMLFNGGLVSSYLTWTRLLNVKNSIAALIFPFLLMNAFNVILMKNYFKANIPSELIEAARIDGAGEFGIFFRIVLPLSTPILATVGLFVAISYWNDWMNGLYFITKRTDLFSLQNYLNRMLTDIQFLNSSANKVSSYTQGVKMPATSIKMALAVVGVVPIMVLYPFFQRYFVKGITIGAVKG
ncbi:MAG: carbohydrate ABC transporter permease [Lachnospiraceae bacterium]|nr:carbohydrate ABC transporter permease [Lachnospiraceae bacterium]